MSGSVKSIRHHQSQAGRDADDAHEQYLLIADHVDGGGGASVHDDLTGRDSVTAHEQYLLVADANIVNWDSAHTHTHVISGNPHNMYPDRLNKGNFNLNGYTVRAKDFIAQCHVLTRCVKGVSDEDLIISACCLEGNALILRGSCGEYQERGGDIIIQTVFNCQYEGAGHIYINTSCDGDIRIHACRDFCVEAVCGNFCVEGCFFIYAGDGIELDAGGDINIDSDEVIAICAGAGMCINSGGDIDINANCVFLHSCVYVDDMYLSCLTITCEESTLLTLKMTCYDPGESCSPFVDFCGALCAVPADCGPILNNAVLGDYGLQGGIHIKVNGCRRYLLFYRCCGEV